MYEGSCRKVQDTNHLPLVWRKDKRKRDGRVKNISIVFCYVINSVCAVVREDSGTFCFPFYGHSKQKIPRQAVCLPWKIAKLSGFGDI